MSSFVPHHWEIVGIATIFHFVQHSHLRPRVFTVHRALQFKIFKRCPEKVEKLLNNSYYVPWLCPIKDRDNECGHCHPGGLG